MAYREYQPVTVPCLAAGCRGDVWVTDQAKLHYYNKSGGERPRGVAKCCEECDAKVFTVTVPCLNEDTGVPGDHACIGNGQILLHDHNPGAAFWYVMNGCRERPRMYPYCESCRVGVVFTGPCSNRGCRNDGTIRFTGDDKQGRLFVAKKTGESSLWPPRNCHACREFIGSLRDLALTCSCCKRPWRWSKERQFVLVRNEPRSAFVQPDLCNACLTLGADERRATQRRALSQEKQRVVRRSMREAVRSAEGRAALRQTSRDRFLALARTMFLAPDRHTIDEKVKAAAVTRVARLGGDVATKELLTALKAVGTDAGRIAAMLANAAISDVQARKVARALGKLAAGGEFPKAFAERLRTPGGLRMTSGLAGTASTIPRIAQAAAYEIHAAAAISDNKKFPYPFSKSEIASFHYRFQHNRYESASKKGSYEGDIVIQHRGVLPQWLLPLPQTFVDFKHSIVGKPIVTRDELERIFHGLTRGEIDRAVIVLSDPLTPSASLPIKEINERIQKLNQIDGRDIPQIRTFVQPW